jgi:hypothetical protein
MRSSPDLAYADKASVFVASTRIGVKVTMHREAIPESGRASERSGATPGIDGRAKRGRLVEASTLGLIVSVDELCLWVSAALDASATLRHPCGIRIAESDSRSARTAAESFLRGLL